MKNWARQEESLLAMVQKDERYSQTLLSKNRVLLAVISVKSENPRRNFGNFQVNH